MLEVSLVFVLFRRHIQSFSSIAKPLHRLSEKATKFHWSDERQTAFLKFKEVLTSPPILAFPRLDLPFILDTDAFGDGIGAVFHKYKII